MTEHLQGPILRLCSGEDGDKEVELFCVLHSLVQSGSSKEVVCGWISVACCDQFATFFSDKLNRI